MESHYNKTSSLVKKGPFSMKQDAFSAGVEPGGLWHKNDIRILLCYILASVGAPLSRQDLTGIIQRKGLANYFESEDALASLVAQGNVTQDGAGNFTVTPAGREIARSLDAALPLSVRDKALEAAYALLSQAKVERENQVEVRKTNKGYQITCHISGGDMDLMAVSLYAPDKAQMELIKKRFYQDPEGIYQLVLAAFTGDRELAKEYFQERNE